uniref:Receptor ligand binding region domain-containing protein n=2 Tax=Xenopus tropicalis TaxID=8364 RepID=A0A803JQE4_XENTR
MSPNELSEIDAIMSLIGHFGWKWVGLVVSNDDTGNRARERLEKAMSKDGVCLDFLIRLKDRVQSDLTDTKKIRETIYRSTAKVIILFIGSQYINYINVIFDPNTVHKKIWIASSSVSHIDELQYLHVFETFNGTLALSFQQGEIPGFKQFLYSLNPYTYQDDHLFTEMWRKIFNCTISGINNIPFPKCTGNETFDDTVLESYGTFNYRIAYGVYTAVYTM